MDKSKSWEIVFIMTISMMDYNPSSSFVTYTKKYNKSEMILPRVDDYIYIDNDLTGIKVDKVHFCFNSKEVCIIGKIFNLYEDDFNSYKDAFEKDEWLIDN